MRKAPGNVHRDKVTAVQIEQRRKMVAANLLAGGTYQEIADALGVAKGTVANDVKAILNGWSKHYADEADKWLRIQLRRYDVLLNAVWDKAKKGDHAAIDRTLKILERCDRLLGVEAPEKLDLTSQGEKIGLTINIGSRAEPPE